MDDTAAFMGQDEQHEEHCVGDGWHDKEIQGHEILHVIREKVFHVGDGGLGGRIRYFSTVDFVTLMPSLCSSPTIRGEPHVGFACHIVLDELTDLFGNRGTARRALLAQLSPVVAKALALPGDHGTRLHECQGALPPRPQTRQPRPEQTIGRPELRTMQRFVDTRRADAAMPGVPGTVMLETERGRQRRLAEPRGREA